MDARITKSRLANFLSYDWLKILIAIAFAVAALAVFFTTVRTRPRRDQEFSVFAYSDLSTGTDSSGFGDELYEGGAFSYDILLVSAESFHANMFAGAAYSARRAAGSGDVMFIGNAALDDGDDATEDKGTLQTFVEGNLIPGDDGQRHLETLLDAEQYFKDADAYLAQYFAGDWRAEGAEVDADRAAQCFLARNGKDKRYKTEEKKAQGIEEEKERFRKLRSDLLAVERAFSDGTLSLTTISTELGDYTVGIRLGNLTGLTKLYYYDQKRDGETVHTVEEVNLVLFNNGERTGDLRFEGISFLRYLLDHYA